MRLGVSAMALRGAAHHFSFAFVVPSSHFIAFAALFFVVIIAIFHAVLVVLIFSLLVFAC